MLRSSTLVLLVIQFGLAQNPYEQLRKASLISLSLKWQTPDSSTQNPGSNPSSANSAPDDTDRTMTACVTGKVRYGKAPVAGVTIILTDVTLGTTLKTTTSEDGSYSFCKLLAGDYRLRTQDSKGTAEESISLKKEQQLRLDLTEK